MTTAPKAPPRAISHLLHGFGDPASAGALAGLAFDFAIDQPISRYVTPEHVLEHIDAALRPAPLERWAKQHLRPSLDRERARARARGDRVGDWLTAEAAAELRSLAARPVHLKKAFLEGLMKQDAVRHMLRGIVQETLDRFVTMLKPGGSGGGLVGAVGRGAFGLAGSVGKGILGGIGGQIEGQLGKAVTAFLDTSMNFLLDRVVALASSNETAALIGRMNVQGFDEAMKVRTGKLWDGLDQVPVDDLVALIPDLIAHNLSRPEIREGILDEARQALAVEGERTVRALLEDSGSVQMWRGRVVEVGGPLLAEWSATPHFRDWIDAHSK
jgi:hypothetical protein